MKKTFSRLAAAAMATVMSVGMMALPSKAADPSLQSKLELRTRSIKPVDIGRTMTSAGQSRIQFAEDDIVSLKSGNYMKWIDRIDAPQYTYDFYDQLVEASDGDGKDDWLIDPSTAKDIEGYKVMLVTTISGRVKSEAELDHAIKSNFDEACVCVDATIDAFDRDHPEVFWLGGDRRTFPYYYTYTDDPNHYLEEVYLILQKPDFDIRLDQYTDSSTIKNDIARQKNYISSITSNASGNAAQKVRYFNQWLTKANGYNTQSNPPASSRIGITALEGNHGETGPVCEGYARAFKILCDAVGIPCCLCDGFAISDPQEKGEAHMWNILQIGKEWYGVDVTWNDPTGPGGTDGDGYEDYLLVGSETVVYDMPFMKSHPVENSASEDGICFTNQPVMSKESFEESGEEDPAEHVHNYTDSFVKATPTQEGKLTQICVDCGARSSESISPCSDIKLSKAKYSYNGQVQKPSILVKDASGTSIGSEHYTVSWPSGCKNAGTYSVKITFNSSKYSGSKVLSYEIAKAVQKFTGSNYTKPLGTAAFTINTKRTVGDGKLTYSSSNTKVATITSSGKLTIKGVGKTTISVVAAATSNYVKTIKKITVTVTPKKMNLKKVVNTAKSTVTASWTKNTAVTGYQIQYALNDKFTSSPKTVTITKNSIVSKKITRLIKNRKYYFRIRGYKTVSGVKYYAPWSTVLKLTITK